VSKPDPSRVASAFVKKARTTLGFSNSVNGVGMGLYQTQKSIDSLLGMIHYRVRGGGSQKAFGDGPFLAPDEKKKVLAIESEIKKAQGDIKDLIKKLGELRKQASELDSVMQYT
jgi:hypothetical protein